MTETETICPYTGLRSFTEEESLYFKGRDIQVDQITALLEQNKFLMVTGASGEGKSSLIYGGLIPNARAGFFKAHYTNWVVADFRPERSPVKNMAKALAEKFGRQPSTIETELRRGFSSLVDLYTNSEFYIDEQDENWIGLSDSGRKERKRKAANLLILVDQFEEFFTNPENFYNEALSQDSQIVVNLVLETARIALKRSLPVYVICTMRSDFIGQCAAFRGLPEYIGFSQFFVPRLKRKDLKQVIEEPAVLSGNRITQRLIERLVFDLAEGIDQLPILQHTLSQIWLAADHGREEMDLVHYAMVGGMPSSELPDDDQQRFLQWFHLLPEYKRSYFHSTGLNKVIEIHANSLYEGAWEYHNALHPENPVTRQEAKKIVAMTFACLTKIDNSRAVRNRMTLKEITDIINTPGLTAVKVGAALSIYREEGNAFIRPFKTEEPATHALAEDTVLDITHESLIRNWNKLDGWAKTEFEFYTTFLDFRTQLNRWKKNGKSSGYLLPIGPLTYFENWYVKCKPNAGWINRYNDSNGDHRPAHAQDGQGPAGQSHIESSEILSDTREFLKRSAGQVAITRAFMKYGTQRIATLLAIFIMLVLSGFYWYDAEQKRNERVIEQIRSQAKNLLPSAEVGNNTKASYLLTEERYQPGTILNYLGSLDIKSKVGLAIESYRLLLEYDKHFRNPIKRELIEFTLKGFTDPEFEKDPEFALIHRNKFIIHLVYDEYHNPSEARKKTINELANANHMLAVHFFNNVKLIRPTVPSELNLAIQLWLTFAHPDQLEISELIKLISPRAGDKSLATFNAFYPKGSFEPNGREPSDFNGGYHTLASLYAAAGDVEGITWCFDNLIRNGQKNYLELARVFNNHINVLGYLYQYGYRSKAPQLVKWIASNTEGNPPLTLYRNAVLRSGYIYHLYNINVYKQSRSYKGYFNLNLCLAHREVFNALMEDYQKVINEVKNPDERNFLLAMNYKRKAMFISKYHYDRYLPLDKAQLNSLFEKAISHYRLVSQDYVNTNATITIPYFTDGVRTRTYTRKQLFVYPDYMDGWFSRPYHSDAFFVYLKEKDLLNELYQTASDIESIHLWLSKAFEVHPFLNSGAYRKDYPLSDKVLTDILLFVEAHPQGKNFDKNLPTIILANRFLESGDSVNGLKYFRQLDQVTLQRSSNRYEYIETTFFLNQLKDLSVNLALHGRHKEAMGLAERMKEDYQKVYSYISMAENAYRKDTSAMTFVYLDSVFSINKRIDFNASPLDNRFNLVHVLSSIGGEQVNSKALEILRDFTQNAKTGGHFEMIWGVAREGNYYKAMSSIPSTFTESQDLNCRNLILWEECKKSESQTSAREWKSMDQFYTWEQVYVFYQNN